MKINKIELKNFRNYKELCIYPNENINYFYGENGQGKTNLIESIFYCSSGRSNRTVKDTELIKSNEDFLYINIDFEKNLFDSKIEVLKRLNGKKGVKVNGIVEKKMANIVGLINSVIFSPEDLKIVKGAPAERRRFIDILLSQISSTYYSDLQIFLKALDQRNKLLKEIKKKQSYNDILEDWDRTLAKYAGLICFKRVDITNKINLLVGEKSKNISYGRENLILKYLPNILNKTEYEDMFSYSAKDFEDKYIRVLKNFQKNDIIRETTAYGPQRDDWELEYDNASIKSFGSQGQQRTAVLALKLSEVDIYTDIKGEKPIILLDDVMSELDENRRKAINSIISDNQTFFTGTDKNFLDGGQHAIKYYNIYGGCVLEES